MCHAAARRGGRLAARVRRDGRRAGRAPAQGSRGSAMTHPYWPLFDLRLRTADLELRPMTEADLAQLADELPDDLEQDPSATTYDVADARVAPWHRRAPELLEVLRVVATGGMAAELRRAPRWSADRRPGARGQRLSRVADRGHVVLSRCRCPRPRSRQGDARGRARSRVRPARRRRRRSRRPGTTTTPPSGSPARWATSPTGSHAWNERAAVGVDVLHHLMLKREAWLASGRGDDVEIEGFDPCRPFFGLPRPEPSDDRPDTPACAAEVARRW